MKNTSVILLASFLLFSCMDEHPSKEKLKKEPFEYLYYARSYPDNSLQYKEIDVLNKRVRKQIETQQKLSDTTLWRLEGPLNIGGRINTIAADPDDMNTIFVGNAAGGVFKTTNGGDVWLPVGDEFSNLSIGAIAIAPTNSQVIYVGTGDPNISGLPQVGDGVYKSMDGGDSWEHKGLELPKIVSRIVVDPTDENIVYAATMGLPFERNDDRGLYKTIDGGDTWEKILFVSDQAGITDCVIDSNNPSVIYASSWNRIRNNTESTVTGENAHIYKSVDGGDTWSTLVNGLPEGEQGRIGLAISKTNPNVVYSIWIDAASQIGGVFKTSDAGDSWSEILLSVEMNNAVGGFGWYFGQIRVSPYDENEVSVLGVDLYSSFDGGTSWEMTVPGWYTYEVHADKHDLVYVDQNTLLLATDGGLYRSTNHFSTWEDIENIPNTQFYRVNYNPHQAGAYTGGAQDNGTTTGNYLDSENWIRDYGGDGFQPLFDPNDEQIRYAETQRGNFVKFSGFDWGSFNYGIDVSDRTNWDSPFVISPHNSEVFYTGTYRVYKNIDEYWNPISGDLTDGNIFGDAFHTISTIDESPVAEGVLYVGTSDGNLSRSLDDGVSWDDIDDQLPDRYVTCVKASPVDQNTVFVTHSGYKDNDNTAHIHRSTDNGASWDDITGDLIEQPVNDIEIMNASVYFIATDFGVYMTLNAGLNWTRVGENMPVIPVFDLVIDTVENRLVAGTFARSIQSIDLEALIPQNIDDSVAENASNSQLIIYPNPAVNELKIVGLNGAGTVSIYSMNGKILSSQSFTGFQKNMDISYLKSGNYMIEIIGDSFSKSTMFQVKK